MISRRFFTSGILVLGLSSQSQAAFFGIKTKAEKEADARVETEELNSLKKNLKLAKKKGKKLSSEDLARLDFLKKKEAERDVVSKSKPKQATKKKPDETIVVNKAKSKELSRMKIRSDKSTADLQEAALSPGKVSKRYGKKTYTLDAKFEPQRVTFAGYPSGSIIIDSKQKFLYLMETPFSARRYGVAVGKEGLAFKGTVVVGSKQEWPRWIPTKEMIERDPKQYAKHSGGMDGGPGNPLGARAIYLYEGKKDTYLRIHGTTQPWTIGTAASNGCFRMVNEHVIDLYSRVSVGTTVTVI